MKSVPSPLYPKKLPEGTEEAAIAVKNNPKKHRKDESNLFITRTEDGQPINRSTQKGCTQRTSVNLSRDVTSCSFCPASPCC